MTAHLHQGTHQLKVERDSLLDPTGQDDHMAEERP